MAKHEFGIMQEAPQKGHRYDKYEPKKYSCISVEDNDLENILNQFINIDCFWHTIDMPEKGLDYCGITLIPPTAIPVFISVIQNIYGLSELNTLMQRALYANKWIIHYGL